MQLSQKERTLLEDAKSHEELCIKKYSKYSGEAQCPQLKQIFQSHAQKEQEHLNSINQMLNSGQVPNVGQQGQQQQQNVQAQPQGQASMFNQQDADFCQDMLSAEKYVSQAYDNYIFEFRDSQVRKVLNHIQNEEQKHGEELFNYMQSRGMYQVH